MVTKFSVEVLPGKALSCLLEFIDKTGENVFCLQMQIKLESLRYFNYLVDLFRNKLKTKLITFFTE